MSARLKSVLSLLASLGLAAGLLWLALRNADLGAIGTALAEGEWAWMLPFVLVSMLSVVLRAWRWGLLVNALPETRDADRVGLGLLTGSVCIGYLVNYAAPRLGEVARTVNVARRSEATFSGVLGTVVAERLLDVLALGLVLLGVAWAYGSQLTSIWESAAERVTTSVARVPTEFFWVVALLVVAAVAIAVVIYRRRKVADGASRLAGLVASFRDGLTTILRTRRTGALVASTFLLWTCYAVMSDLPLRILGLNDAYGISLGDAWAVMAVGGIGMALPAPGGTGSFHYATIHVLTVLFGVALTPAATYAILVHAAGVVFYCVLGVVALVAQGTSFRDVTRGARTAAEAT